MDIEKSFSPSFVVNVWGWVETREDLSQFTAKSYGKL